MVFYYCIDEDTCHTDLPTPYDPLTAHMGAVNRTLFRPFRGCIYSCPWLNPSVSYLGHILNLHFDKSTGNSVKNILIIVDKLFKYSVNGGGVVAGLELV